MVWPRRQMMGWKSLLGPAAICLLLTGCSDEPQVSAQSLSGETVPVLSTEQPTVVVAVDTQCPI